MKKIIVVTMILMLTIMFAGCKGRTPTAEDKQTEATKQVLNEMNNQIGMPNVKEFYEKKLAKEIYELRDNSKLICYAYTQAMNGKFIYIGKCMGYGLPYSTQYTNPQQFTRLDAGNQGWSYQLMPQADPNGLYMPSSSSATWMMLIDEDTGKRQVMYCESNTVVTQSKLPKRLVEEWSLTNNY